MNRLFPAASLALLTVLALPPAYAEQSGHPSKYAGEESRAIKSLSADDIDELRRGGGWGLAKPAELNGVPGPAHLLELKDEIPLAPDQILSITALYETMKAQAVQAGQALIGLEAKLDAGFRERRIDDAGLRALLGEIEMVRRELRYIHLATHLQTPEMLSDTQIARYNELRGYTKTDPCASVPTGHDAAVWRRHNGCG